jgi:hypothetical protein
MFLTVPRIVFVGGTIVLWLALSMPSWSFFAQAWIPSVAWLVLGAMAVSPDRLSRALGVDQATYGILAVAIGSIIPGLGAALAAVALFLARYLGTDEGNVGQWTTGGLIGAIFVLILMLSIIPIAVFREQSLGATGTTAAADSRGPMRSTPPPPRSAADFEGDRGGAGGGG